MCKKMLVVICGLLLVSYVTSSQAIIIVPTNPIVIDNNQFSSIEAFEANLQSQQQQLQSQLQQINQQLKSVQNFIAAQKSLGIQWVDASNGQYPKNTLSLKYGVSQTAHICHTTFIHGTHPGILNNAGCLITYGGSSLIEQTYQVLTGKVTTQWQTVNSLDNYQQPEQDANNDTWQQHSVPIQGGYEKGSPLYICQAVFNNATYIGKVVNDNCNFAVGQQEVFVKDFQVLFGDKING